MIGYTVCTLAAIAALYGLSQFWRESVKARKSDAAVRRVMEAGR